MTSYMHTYITMHTHTHVQSRSALQPHIADALKKQSQQIQASAVAMDTPDGKPGDESVLKRGSSKRRSL